MYTIDKETGCWNWALSKDKDGYGRVKRNGKAYGAHRYALMEYLGRELLEGHVCMHLCDNPSCVNPKHLKEGTQSENMIDCIAKGRGGNRGKGIVYPKYIYPRSPFEMDGSLRKQTGLPFKEQRKVNIKWLAKTMTPKEIADKLRLSLKWVRMVIQQE